MSLPTASDMIAMITDFMDKNTDALSDFSNITIDDTSDEYTAHEYLDMKLSRSSYNELRKMCSDIIKYKNKKINRIEWPEVDSELMSKII